jgi:hypothetical protein
LEINTKLAKGVDVRDDSMRWTDLIDELETVSSFGINKGDIDFVSAVNTKLIAVRKMLELPAYVSLSPVQ